MYSVIHQTAAALCLFQALTCKLLFCPELISSKLIINITMQTRFHVIWLRNRNFTKIFYLPYFGTIRNGQFKSVLSCWKVSWFSSRSNSFDSVRTSEIHCSWSCISHSEVMQSTVLFMNNSSHLKGEMLNMAVLINKCF